MFVLSFMTTVAGLHLNVECGDIPATPTRSFTARLVLVVMDKVLSVGVYLKR
jgi:hypothetical protein